jgi:hypothetical protein
LKPRRRSSARGDEFVMAGLDPAIHHLRKTLFQRGWMRGSSPRMTMQSG